MTIRLDNLKKNLNYPELSGNIYCIGRNYRKHVEELANSLPDEPLIFLKSSASLKAVAEKSEFNFSDPIHFEAELIVVIGENLKQNSTVTDETSICGYSLGLDLTRRELQNKLKAKGHPWTRAENFAGSAIIGPFVSSKLKVNELEFEFLLNGKKRQKANCKDMIFSIVEILNSLLKLHDLEAGDLIFTGTPEGVGEIKSGDHYRLHSQKLAIDLEAVL